MNSPATTPTRNPGAQLVHDRAIMRYTRILDAVQNGATSTDIMNSEGLASTGVARNLIYRARRVLNRSI